VRLIDTLVIHHSAGASGNVRTFRAEHIARGWSDIGYHEVITNGHGGPDGSIEQGRPHNQVGAAVFGANTGKLHVCLVGNFQHDDLGYTGKPTRSQMQALGHWLLVNGRRYHYAKVTDHRSCAIPEHGTLCPGSDFPTHLIQDWYYLYAKTLANPSLDEFLARHGYWGHK